MKLAIRAATLALGTMTLAACGSRSPQFTSADEAEVRALFDSTVARVTAADWTGWAGEYADSAVFQAPNAKVLHGRAAILAWGQTFPRVEQFSMSDVRVWGEGNLAYGTSAMAMKLKDAPADTAKQLVVFRRSSAGRWEVAAASFNSDLPAVAMPPVAVPKK